MRYTLVQGFCFFWLFLMGCKELTKMLIFVNFVLVCYRTVHDTYTDALSPSKICSPYSCGLKYFY